ncbi:ABC transporter substrate-binding protein [Plantibacter sp. YIM 135347]|uniref:ABC transporter substrate-binding protein n=1 Tax=Plantibacter sp. YIM 135347 TaxID=3423919 RepID=UPI003D32766E
MRTGKIAAAAVGIAALVALSGCSAGAATDSGGSATVNWWTWDPNQAAAYSECIPAFEKANPDIKVEVSQFNVSDYFTKLTTGFVAKTAPDAFQNSVTFFESYASQGQILAMDDLIKQSKYDTGVFAEGVDLWKYTDGKQYGLPLDWAAAGLYFNKDLVKAAGLTDEQVQNLTWNPKDGGTFLSVVKRLTVDANGVRGDEAGFDKNNVAVYGVGALASDDNLGQTTWGPFAGSTGFKLTDKPNWPTQFNYSDKKFIETMDFMRQLGEDGFAPKLGQFTTGASDQIGSGKVAMVPGGSWEATSLSKLPGVSVGVAPVVASADGVRSVISNMNGNNIWAGTKHQEQTWKWVSYMGSEACQTAAATSNGSFFPSIGASMDALIAKSAKDGVDLSAFGKYQSSGSLFPAPAYSNGAKMEAEIRPQFEAYFLNQVNDDVWPQLEDQTRQIIGG